MTLETMLEIFEELPGRVQTALLSYAWVMKRRGGRHAQDCPRPVAEYLKATGFYDFELRPAVHEDKREYVYLIGRKNEASKLFEGNVMQFHKAAK